MNSSVLIFDLWGDLGHFKKPYTTTSPLSFAFPPRPTLAGIISALIGLGKQEYAEFFKIKNANIGLGIINPVKKMRISHNLINTKNAVQFSRIKHGVKGARTQIRFEYVKDPKYRVYFQHSDQNIFKRVKTCLENHESVYSVSLGLSELLANFEYIGEFGCAEDSSTGPVMINSIIPSNKMNDFTIETGKEYFVENMPVEMDKQRIVTLFGSFIYERNGNPIQAMITTKYYKAENGDTFLFI